LAPTDSLSFFMVDLEKTTRDEASKARKKGDGEEEDMGG
jgi:hypothetical protein